MDRPSTRAYTVERGRFAVASIVALLLATFQLFHSLSAFAERNSPEIVAMFDPWNGHALERLAYKRLISDTDDPGQLAVSAEAALPLAISAFRRQPHVPKAYAIAALAQRDAAARREVLDAAAALDRRDTTLQGVMLAQAVEARDYEATTSAIDKILRVKPQRSQQLFPLLMEGLRHTASADDFAELVDFSAPWHESFLLESALDAEARLTLYRISGRARWESEPLHRRLIAGLAGQGEPGKAEEIYRSAYRADAQYGQPQDGMDWRATYPPFDWVFVSSPSFRAQPSIDGETLHIFARPGQGGVAATRLIPVSDLRFEIGIGVEAEREVFSGELALSVTCLGASNPLKQVELVRGRNSASINAPPRECQFVRVGLQARAIRGQPALKASFDRIHILTSSRPTA